MSAKRPLTIDHVLRWADSHRQRSGQWPTHESGPVTDEPGESWSALRYSLMEGGRGLPGGSSIAQLLEEHRGRRNRFLPPPLTFKEILRWADRHRERSSNWPTKTSGPIIDAPGETWSGVNDAMQRGARSLSGRSSLAMLLAEQRGRRHVFMPPPLTSTMILDWADAHKKRTGRWPTMTSGPVHGVRDESWVGVDGALRFGRRGLPGGSSLPRFLSVHRQRPYQRGGPLSESQIIRWARAFHARTGAWPGRRTPGCVIESTRDTWRNIDSALRAGLRGLNGGTTLLKLLAERCGARHRRFPPPLTIKQILAWSDAHKARTGRWPMASSGPVHGRQGESWSGIIHSLRAGTRGQARGTSLAQLLARHRGRPNPADRTPLKTRDILAWTDAHQQRTGRWPSQYAGPVSGVAGETWLRIDSALRSGRRRLRGGSSLAQLLARHRGRPLHQSGVTLTKETVLAWADSHHKRTGRWPTRRSGRIVDAPGHETWHAVSAALMIGYRGLPGGFSLRHLLAKERGRFDMFDQPRLTISQILRWADAHYASTGRWPTYRTRRIPGTAHEDWNNINFALMFGRRGLPRGTTLNQVLVKHRGKYDKYNPPRLTIARILRWGDFHYHRTGDWPYRLSGRITEAPCETWLKINVALMLGRRGLRGGSSIVKLLSAKRPKLYRRRGLPLKRSTILDWIAAHHELTGELPNRLSGSVRDQRGETWAAIDASLQAGTRTLRGGESLPELVLRHYTPPYPHCGQPLTVRNVIDWAESFKQRVGRWPTHRSAYTDTSRTEKWSTIDIALREGLRGLPGGSSLAKLLREHAVEARQRSVVSMARRRSVPSDRRRSTAGNH